LKRKDVAYWSKFDENENLLKNKPNHKAGYNSSPATPQKSPELSVPGSLTQHIKQ